MPEKKSARSWVIFLIVMLGCVYFVWKHFYSPKLSLELQGKIEADRNLKLQAVLANVSSTKLSEVSLFCSLKVDIPNLSTEVKPAWTPPPGDPLVWADNLRAFMNEPKLALSRDRSPETFWTKKSFKSWDTATIPCVPSVPLEPQTGERIQVFTILTYSSSGIGSFEREAHILFEGFPDPQGRIAWFARDWGTFRTSIFYTE
jgi:hypothetical protein